MVWPDSFCPWYLQAYPIVLASVRHRLYCTPETAEDATQEAAHYVARQVTRLTFPDFTSFVRFLCKSAYHHACSTLRRDYKYVAIGDALRDMLLGQEPDDMDRQHLAACLRRLPQPSLDMLEMKFGFKLTDGAVRDAGNPMTLQEIGDEFGFSIETARRRLAAALGRLRQLFFGDSFRGRE